MRIKVTLMMHDDEYQTRETYGPYGHGRYTVREAGGETRGEGIEVY